jgi:hypothetical protein
MRNNTRGALLQKKKGMDRRVVELRAKVQFAVLIARDRKHCAVVKIRDTLHCQCRND